MPTTTHSGLAGAAGASLLELWSFWSFGSLSVRPLPASLGCFFAAFPVGGCLAPARLALFIPAFPDFCFSGDFFSAIKLVDTVILNAQFRRLPIHTGRLQGARNNNIFYNLLS